MYDIIIIGGGVSGLSAGIFAARSRLKTLILDKGGEFSSISKLTSVNDLPGFENTPGVEILNRMRKQAISEGAEIKNVAATSCMITENSKKVVTNEPATYETKAIILATGSTAHSESHVYPGEKELLGKGVSHDVEANLSACKGNAVAIVGKSTSVAESALALSKIAEKVYWVIPASKLDLNQKLKEDLEGAKRVEPFFSSSLKKINGTSEVTSVTILTAGQEKTLSVKQIFLQQQQYKPVTEYLNGTGIQTGPEGVIMISQQFETGIQGIFAAGNILCSKPQLNVVCSAQGAIAALNAEKFLRSL